MMSINHIIGDNMDETEYIRNVDRIEAIDVNRQRDLQFRANELGISIIPCQHEKLDITACELSRMIDEGNDGN